MIAGSSTVALTAALLMTLALSSCTTTTTTGVTDASLVRATTDSAPSTRARIKTELGAGYFTRGNYEIALEELNGAVREDPSYAPAHGVLGLVYSELRDDPQAERHFTRAIELAPQDPEVRNNYGWHLCQRGREAQAIQQFDLAIRNPFYRTPDMALVNAGRCAIRMGDRRMAQAYFDRALSIAPASGQVNYALAEMAYKAGDLPTARTRMRVASQNLSSPESLMLGACIERKLGNKSEETNYIVQLRQRFPNAREAKLVDSGGCL
jgi:type IV pilus assembly protein PilF